MFFSLICQISSGSRKALSPSVHLRTLAEVVCKYMAGHILRALVNDIKSCKVRTGSKICIDFYNIVKIFL